MIKDVPANTESVLSVPPKLMFVLGGFVVDTEVNVEEVLANVTLPLKLITPSKVLLSAVPVPEFKLNAEVVVFADTVTSPLKVYVGVRLYVPPNLITPFALFPLIFTAPLKMNVEVDPPFHRISPLSLMLVVPLTTTLPPVKNLAPFEIVKSPPMVIVPTALIVFIAEPAVVPPLKIR